MRTRSDRGVVLPLLTVLLSSGLWLATSSVASAAGTEPPSGGGAAGPSAPAAGGAEAGAPSSSPSGPGAGSGGGAAGSSAKTPDAASAGKADATAADASSSPPAAAPETAERKMVPSLSHDLQFGLAVMPGGGYRIVFPYKEGVDCGDQNNAAARVCTARVPFFIDLQPSFGISQGWDFLVDVRLSFEQNVFHYHEVFLMPGFRYWLDPQNHVKFYTTIQLAYDATKQRSSTLSSSDVGIRNSNGLMVEIMRNFGVYFQFGETVGFVRWLSFNVDAGIGIQARVP